MIGYYTPHITSYTDDEICQAASVWLATCYSGHTICSSGYNGCAFMYTITGNCSEKNYCASKHEVCGVYK